MSNREEHISKLIDEAIDSVDHAQRATPMPFLLTRVNNRLNKIRENSWDKWVGFIGRPAVAIPALAVLILINVTVIIYKSADLFTGSTEQFMQPPADEFSNTVATIYDIENTEP